MGYGYGIPNREVSDHAKQSVDGCELTFGSDSNKTNMFQVYWKAGSRYSS